MGLFRYFHSKYAIGQFRLSFEPGGNWHWQRNFIVHRELEPRFLTTFLQALQITIQNYYTNIKTGYFFRAAIKSSSRLEEVKDLMSILDLDQNSVSYHDLHASSSLHMDNITSMDCSENVKNYTKL